MINIKESNDCSQAIERFISDYLGLKDYRIVSLSQGRLADVRKVESKSVCLVIKGEKLGYYSFDPINLEFRIMTYITSIGGVNVPRPIAQWSDGKHSLVAMEFVPGNTYAEMPVRYTMAELSKIASVTRTTIELLNDFFMANPQDAALIREARTVRADKIVEKSSKYIDGILDYKERISSLSNNMHEPLVFYPDFRAGNFITFGGKTWIFDFNTISFGRPSESISFLIDDFMFDGFREEMITGLCKDSHGFHSAATYMNPYSIRIINLQDFDLKGERIRFHLRCAAESSRVMNEMRLEKMFREAIEKHYARDRKW